MNRREALASVFGGIVAAIMGRSVAAQPNGLPKVWRKVQPGQTLTGLDGSIALFDRQLTRTEVADWHAWPRPVLSNGTRAVYWLLGDNYVGITRST